MKYKEALELLDNYINYERVSKYPGSEDSFGTERMNLLLELINNPHQDFAVIHIAGTKGKGSTAYLTAAVLRKLGLQCGLYTSPHIVNIRERIQVNNAFISEQEFAECFAIIHEKLQELSGDDIPTYFEILTAIAFFAFSRRNIDIAVIEVGLGGRLDATNIASLPVAATGITPISYDHSALLGDSLESIAFEKASIIRRKVPVVMGRQESSAATVVVKKARENDCRLKIVGVDIEATVVDEDSEVPSVQIIDIKTSRKNYKNMALPLQGRHQLDNAAMAISLIEEFLEAPIEQSVLEGVWNELVIPGRLEIAGAMPWIILDASHNPASIWALSEYFQKYFTDAQKKVLVFSACADKDVKAMLKILVPLFDIVVFTTNNSSRHVPPSELAEITLKLYPNLQHDVKDNPLSAVDMAIHLAGEEGVVVICGSMYLVGDIRDFCLTVGQFAKI